MSDLASTLKQRLERARGGGAAAPSFMQSLFARPAPPTAPQATAMRRLPGPLQMAATAATAMVSPSQAPEAAPDPEIMDRFGGELANAIGIKNARVYRGSGPTMYDPMAEVMRMGDDAAKIVALAKREPPKGWSTMPVKVTVDGGETVTVPAGKAAAAAAARLKRALAVIDALEKGE